MNSIQLIGYLGADPEKRSFESGSTCSLFTLYVNERYKDQNKQPQERVHRFPVESWGATADYVATYLKQGNRVSVSGKLIENTWKEGDQNRSRVVVRAQNIENLTVRIDAEETDDSRPAPKNGSAAKRTETEKAIAQ